MELHLIDVVRGVEVRAGRQDPSWTVDALTGPLPPEQQPKLHLYAPPPRP